MSGYELSEDEMSEGESYESSFNVDSTQESTQSTQQADVSLVDIANALVVFTFLPLLRWSKQPCVKGPSFADDPEFIRHARQRTKKDSTGAAKINCLDLYGNTVYGHNNNPDRLDNKKYIALCPLNYNLGFCTGFNKFFIVDIDCVDKKTGKVMYDVLQRARDLFRGAKLGAVFIVRTQSGGYHIYLRCRNEKFNNVMDSARVELTKIDLLKGSCYALFPGSVIRRPDGSFGEYNILSQAPSCLDAGFTVVTDPDKVDTFVDDIPNLMFAIENPAVFDDRYKPSSSSSSQPVGHHAPSQTRKRTGARKCSIEVVDFFRGPIGKAVLANASGDICYVADTYTQSHNKIYVDFARLGIQGHWVGCPFNGQPGHDNHESDNFHPRVAFCGKVTDISSASCFMVFCRKEFAVERKPPTSFYTVHKIIVDSSTVFTKEKPELPVPATIDDISQYTLFDDDLKIFSYVVFRTSSTKLCFLERREDDFPRVTEVTTAELNRDFFSRFTYNKKALTARQVMPYLKEKIKSNNVFTSVVVDEKYLYMAEITYPHVDNEFVENSMEQLLCHMFPRLDDQFLIKQYLFSFSQGIRPNYMLLVHSNTGGVGKSALFNIICEANRGSTFTNLSEVRGDHQNGYGRASLENKSIIVVEECDGESSISWLNH